jgi:hypothetical protein
MCPLYTAAMCPLYTAAMCPLYTAAMCPLYTAAMCPFYTAAMCPLSLNALYFCNVKMVAAFLKESVDFPTALYYFLVFSFALMLAPRPIEIPS